MTIAPGAGEGGGGTAAIQPGAAQRAAKAVIYAKKLHLGHFAFMRAVVQGLDTRGSWDRYLRLEGEHDDIRNVRRTIQWIRDEFAAAAKRHERFGTARLVQIDASRIVEKTQALPSLEEFIEEFGLYDFSESEQLEHYQERYGAQTGSASRRARLIAKQLEALAWLESLEAQAPPKATDPLESWINPDVAAHFAAVGIRTIRHLVDRINGMGQRWWSGIPAVGAIKARRVTEWLRANEASTGLRLGAHIEVKRSALAAQTLARVVARATAIVPLEKLVIPPELDGAAGLNRAPQHACQIPAKNDMDAVCAWIRGKQGLTAEEKADLKRKRGVDPAAPEGPLDWLGYLSHTQRAYRKEAERLLLWSVLQRKKALSSLLPEDCAAYAAFLANPVPTDAWCAPRSREKWSPLWRPFEGPLSPRAQRHAVTILKNLFQFLSKNGYLLANPWDTIATPEALNRMDGQRALTPGQWRFVEARLAQLPATSAAMRLRLALLLIYATGLRLSEAVKLRVGDLRHVRYAAAGEGGASAGLEGWELAVGGKGRQRRHIPIPTEICATLSCYLVSRGLHADLAHPQNAGAHVIGKASDVVERAPWAPSRIREVDPTAGVSVATLAKEFRRFFDGCAALLREQRDPSAPAFAAASAQWLRHTHGRHALAAGLPLDVVQDTLGHASAHTTKAYVEADSLRRVQAMNVFWQQRNDTTVD